MNKHKKYIRSGIVLSLITLPLFSFADSTLGCTLNSGPKLADLLNYVSCILIKSVVPLIFALAFVMFIWGVVMYVINTSEEAKKEKGRQFMIWGLIALTVMVSVWGIVKIFTTTFNIDTVIPQLQNKVQT